MVLVPLSFQRNSIVNLNVVLIRFQKKLNISLFCFLLNTKRLKEKSINLRNTIPQHVILVFSRLVCACLEDGAKYLNTTCRFVVDWFGLFSYFPFLISCVEKYLVLAISSLSHE